MRPILFELFGLAFPSWHVFFALGGVAAYFFALWILKIFSNENSIQLWPKLFGACYLSGWFGARLFSILTEDFGKSSVAEVFAGLFEFGAMTFYGGAIASTVTGILFLQIQEKSKRKLGIFFDACLPAAVLGLGIGRLGCFLNGDDFGKPVEFNAALQSPPFWSVVFPNLEDNVYRYPAQLQEAFFCFILFLTFVVLIKFKTKLVKKHFGFGKISAWITILSATNRFFNEFLRGDPRGQFLSSKLSTSQGIAVILIAISIGYLFFLRGSHNENASNS